MCQFEGKYRGTGLRSGRLHHREPATVRAAAQKFGISKSTVHKDLSERLPLYNRPLYLQVKAILDENKPSATFAVALPPAKNTAGMPEASPAGRKSRDKSPNSTNSNLAS